MIPYLVRLSRLLRGKRRGAFRHRQGGYPFSQKDEKSMDAQELVSGHNAGERELRNIYLA